MSHIAVRGVGDAHRHTLLYIRYLGVVPIVVNLIVRVDSPHVAHQRVVSTLLSSRLAPDLDHHQCRSTLSSSSGGFQCISAVLDMSEWMPIPYVPLLPLGVGLIAYLSPGLT